MLGFLFMEPPNTGLRLSAYKSMYQPFSTIVINAHSHHYASLFPDARHYLIIMWNVISLGNEERIMGFICIVAPPA